MTEYDLKQLEEALQNDQSSEAKEMRDLIDQVRALRSLVQQARSAAQPEARARERSGA
jgi:hypothetical protein